MASILTDLRNVAIHGQPFVLVEAYSECSCGSVRESRSTFDPSEVDSIGQGAAEAIAIEEHLDDIRDVPCEGCFAVTCENPF